MADVIKLEIVTPSGIALSRDVLEVNAPTLDGEIGVLPGHLPLLAAVRTGMVAFRPASGGDGEPMRYAVAHGVFEIANEKALLITEKFMKKEDVDVVAVRARFKDVGEELRAWDGDLEDKKRSELIEEEQWLATQLELIGDPPQETSRELTRFKVKDVEPVITEDSGDAEGGSDAS